MQPRCFSREVQLLCKFDQLGALSAWTMCGEPAPRSGTWSTSWGQCEIKHSKPPFPHNFCQECGCSNLISACRSCVWTYHVLTASGPRHHNHDDSFRLGTVSQLFRHDRPSNRQTRHTMRTTHTGPARCSQCSSCGPSALSLAFGIQPEHTGTY